MHKIYMHVYDYKNYYIMCFTRLSFSIRYANEEPHDSTSHQSETAAHPR